MCLENAKYELFDSGKRKHYLCLRCGEFIITVGAEKRLSESIPAWRIALKEAVSKAPDESMLEIRLSPVAGRQAGIGYHPIDTEYIPHRHR